jgi:tripartite-type tricarboxylate transporter receptor subunit TctC
MTKLSRRTALLHLPALSLALAASTRMAPAVDYPTRPVHMIVGLAAGGPTDLVARVVAQWLSEHMNNSSWWRTGLAPAAHWRPSC